MIAVIEKRKSQKRTNIKHREEIVHCIARHCEKNYESKRLSEGENDLGIIGNRNKDRALT